MSEEAEPVELTNCYQSPELPTVWKSSQTKPGTPAIHMTCVAGINGKTPGKGSVISKPSKEFIECCSKCGGVFPPVKFDPEKKEQRMACSVCRQRTTHFC